MAVSAPVQNQETASAQKPVETFRSRGVSASVFANKAKVDGRETTFHKVSVQRTYKDGDEFKHTTSFSRDDLPVLAKVVQDAWAFILDAEAARGKDEAAE